MAYATADDVASRLGRELEEGEILLVETRLGDAELLIKQQIPDLDARVADTIEWPDYEALVVMVEAEMILRLVRNPDGYSQESDGNYSYAIYQAVASGKLEIMDSEWELLGLKRSGMFVITPNLPATGWIEGAYDPANHYPPWWYDFPGPVGPYGPVPL